MTTPESTATRSISVDRFIPASPERVWASITQPEHLAKWWAPGNIEPTVGHQFILEMPGWGNVACEVLEVHEHDLFIYTFADWTLTWRVIAEGHGTRLLLEHSGFDLERPDHKFAFDNMGPGWRDEVLPRLSQVIDAELDAESSRSSESS